MFVNFSRKFPNINEIVVNVTLKLGGHGQSATKSITLFNISIMTSHQPSLDALVYLNVFYS